MAYDLVRVESVTGFRPSGVRVATITGIFWDAEKERIAVSLLYDNGATDWIPVQGIEGLEPNCLHGHDFRIANKK